MSVHQETCAVCGAQGSWSIEFDEYGKMICDACANEIVDESQVYGNDCPGGKCEW